MKISELLDHLEYWAVCLENPTYNPLEVGFRHSPLTKDEIIDRYKKECDITRANILWVIKIINEEDIQ